LSEHLAEAFGASLVMQTYSRLVIDCNRPLDHPTSIPVISERTEIPGNVGLPAAQAEARAREIFAPYHAALAGELDARAGLPTLLVAMHSFTPVYMGVARPWQAGVLYHLEQRLAAIMIGLLRAEGDLTVGDNEPYVLTGTSDYTVPHHAEARGLPYLELEIRQDLIADAAGQRAWADRLARLLPLAWQAYNSG
jgi:predicted N-formylglutamate amidohydrolase